MEKENLNHIKKLFNAGKLKLSDAEYYNHRGYDIVCRAGKVQYILTTADEPWEEYCREVS